MFNFIKGILNNLFPQHELAKLYYLFALMLLVGFLETLGLASIAPFLGIVTDPSLIDKHSLIHSVYSKFEFREPRNFIAFLGVIFLIMMILNSVINIILGWRINIFVQYTTARLSQERFKQYMFMPYTFYLDTHSSEISKNILNEVSRAVELVIYPLLIALSKFSVSILIAGMLILIDPILALTCFGTFFIYYLVIYNFLKKKVVILGSAISEDISLRFKIISESIAGIKHIKLENREEEYISLFKKPSESFAKHIVSNQLKATLPKGVIEILSYGLITSMIIYLSLEVPSAGKRVSLIALYGFSAYRLIPALHLAYESLIQARFNFSALEDLSSQLSKKHKNFDFKSDEDQLDFSSNVKLTDVSYCYPSSKINAVENISLEITPGSRIGIVGVSGSGKSTLVDVILGLLKISSGEIKVGTVKLSPENIISWQKQISYVPQDIFLFDGSIEQNIAFTFNTEPIERDRLARAIQLSMLTDFVSALPNKESTFIGERGVKISGGQRQRIGIARALYKRSNVIILDEATSAIDVINERKITQSFEELQAKHSIITITHRISVLKNCDIIYSMKEGKIISSGSFNYLWKNCPYFQNLSNLSQS